MPSAALLLADAADSLNIGTLAQYGVLGVFAAILVFFARGAHQRERDRADRLEDENRRLNAIIQDRVIPALGSATKAAEESAILLTAIQREREVQREAQREAARLQKDT